MFVLLLALTHVTPLPPQPLDSIPPPSSVQQPKPPSVDWRDDEPAGSVDVGLVGDYVLLGLATGGVAVISSAAIGFLIAGTGGGLNLLAVVPPVATALTAILLANAIDGVGIGGGLLAGVASLLGGGLGAFCFAVASFVVVDAADRNAGGGGGGAGVVGALVGGFFGAGLGAGGAAVATAIGAKVINGYAPEE